MDNFIITGNSSKLTLELDHTKFMLTDGIVCFDSKGRRHNSSGPAVISNSGAKQWWVHGKPHRIDGPAMLVPAYQSSFLIFIKKVLVKINKIFNLNIKIDLEPKDCLWYRNGKLHREDGPAVDFTDKKEYYLDDIKYSYKEWQKRVKLNFLI